VTATKQRRTAQGQRRYRFRFSFLTYASPRFNSLDKSVSLAATQLAESAFYSALLTLYMRTNGPSPRQTVISIHNATTSLLLGFARDDRETRGGLTASPRTSAC